jgi:hypothetical protein
MRWCGIVACCLCNLRVQLVNFTHLPVSCWMFPRAWALALTETHVHMLQGARGTR